MFQSSLTVCGRSSSIARLYRSIRRQSLLGPFETYVTQTKPISDDLAKVRNVDCLGSMIMSYESETTMHILVLSTDQITILRMRAALMPLQASCVLLDEIMLMKLLHREVYDAILLDTTTMPDTVAFCQQIRIQTTVPILIFTDHEDVDTIVMLLRAGADDVIKPSTPLEEIHARLCAKLRQHHIPRRRAKAAVTPRLRASRPPGQLHVA